jgi:hypothetical protein
MLHGCHAGRRRLRREEANPPGQLASAALAERTEAIAAMELAVSQAGRDAAVQGSEILLTRMVENVIDNVVRHNQHGGWIQVTAQADGAQARLVVETGGRMLDDREIRELAPGRLTVPGPHGHLLRLPPDTSTQSGRGTASATTCPGSLRGVVRPGARPARLPACRAPPRTEIIPIA